MKEMKELLEKLKHLPSPDMSEGRYGTKKEPLRVEGVFNRLDLSGSKGHVHVVSEFTNIIDVSNCEGLILILEGKFNIVDGSGGKIKIDIKRAVINILDLSDTKEISLEDLDIPE